MAKRASAVERLRPDLAGRHVLQDHGAKREQAGQIARHRRRRDGLHAELARRQRAAQIVRTAAGIDEQDRGGRFDAHRAVAEVVLGHAVAFRGELEAIARDAGPIDQVAKRQLRRAGLKASASFSRISTSSRSRTASVSTVRSVRTDAVN